MLLFVTSIRHPLNSSSYARVVSLLEDSLASVCNQDFDAFHVIVVHNELPKLQFAHPHVDLLSVSFPPGSAVTGAQTPLEDCQLDKGLKNVVGLLHGRQYQATHVMFFDADDYVHCSLARLVYDAPDANGWYAQRGWVLKNGSDRVRAFTPFHQANGTSIILRDDLLRLPSIEAPTDYYSLIRSVDSDYVRLLFGSHRKTVQYFADRQFPLRIFPFEPAVWLLETGENHSGTSANIGTDERLIDDDFRRCYGIFRSF